MSTRRVQSAAAPAFVSAGHGARPSLCQRPSVFAACQSPGHRHRCRLQMSCDASEHGRSGTYSSKSEPSSSSMASAASRIHLRSWFAFCTLCWAVSIWRANWTLAFSLSKRYSSTCTPGISSSSAQAVSRRVQCAERGTCLDEARTANRGQPGARRVRTSTC